MIRSYRRGIIEATAVLAVYLSVPGVYSTAAAKGIYQLIITAAVNAMGRVEQLKEGLAKLV
jgi:hypothetical protein